MKVTPKNTGILILVATFHAFSIATVGTLKIEHIRYTTYLTYLVNFFIEGTYIITLLYLQQVLKYLNQKQGIILAFWIYIVYDAFAFLLRMFIVGTSLINGKWVFNLISVAVTLYFIIRILGISNFGPCKSFRLLSIALLVSGIVRTIAAVLLIQHYAGRSMLWYMITAKLLPPFALLYILYKTSIYLNHEVFKQAALSYDEPA